MREAVIVSGVRPAIGKAPRACSNVRRYIRDGTSEEGGGVTMRRWVVLVVAMLLVVGMSGVGMPDALAQAPALRIGVSGPTQLLVGKGIV